MSERPTPEELAEEHHLGSTGLMLKLLAQHGYRIVHPDDVGSPVRRGFMRPEVPSQAFDDGWNECRRHIFGGRQ